MSKKLSNKLADSYLADLQKQINSKAGNKIAYGLNDVEDPTVIKDWISTGSRLLDSVICQGKMGGIPSGRIVEIAGPPASTKTYLAQQISANASNKGYYVLYFDSEVAVDQKMFAKLGADTSKIMTIFPNCLEDALEIIDGALNAEKKHLFVLDSIANISCRAEKEAGFEIGATIAIKPRVLSRAFTELTVPLAKNNSTLLVINQLYTNITSNRVEMLMNPFIPKGGKSLRHAFSLALWTFPRKGKDHFIYNNAKEAIGSEVKVKVEKSRFLTYKREASFKILWTGTNNPGIQDELSWFKKLKDLGILVHKSQGWYHFPEDSNIKNFKESQWEKLLKDEEIKKKVIGMLNRELIENFAKGKTKEEISE